MPYEHNKLYDSPRWRKARRAYLSDPEHVLCVMCLKRGRTAAATVVDHIKPHKGNLVLFWDPSNWQGLCATCHSSAKQLQERHGYTQACDVDGCPTDAGHPWSKD